MQTMGNLCHEVAKLQADRAQLEELLAQVLSYLAVADFATFFASQLCHMLGCSCAQLETHGPGALFSAAAYPVHNFLVRSWQAVKTRLWIGCNSIQKVS